MSFSDSTVHFLTTFLAGGTSASLAVTAIAPLERIKLLLQIQRGASNIAASQEYKGIVDCMVRIPKEEGFLSFWRGNWASVIRCFPYQALNFSLKDLFKGKFSSESEIVWERLAGNILAGGMAGACALSVIYPLDYARTRLALDVGKGEKRQFKSVSHCIGTTFKNHGMGAVYKGFVFSVFGVFIYRAMYFGAYDTIMECVRPEYSHSVMIEFPAAEFSAILAGVVSYPLDTVRRRMMLQNHRPQHQFQNDLKHVHYGSTFECWMKIYRTEGMRGYFHGGLTNVYRGTGGALMLVFYDHIQQWFLGDHPFLSKYLPIRHEHFNPTEMKTSEGHKAELNMSYIKKPCKIFKDRCVFCNF